MAASYFDVYVISTKLVVFVLLSVIISSIAPLSGGYFGSGNGTVLLGNLLCYGTETNILDCNSRSWNFSAACPPGNVASIDCSRGKHARVV